MHVPTLLCLLRLWEFWAEFSFLSPEKISIEVGYVYEERFLLSVDTLELQRKHVVFQGPPNLKLAVEKNKNDQIECGFEASVIFTSHFLRYKEL